MLANQATIDALAKRIKRAYSRHLSPWREGCSSTLIWAVVAKKLIDLNASDSRFPADPELFVAAQAMEGSFVDPWIDLTEDRCLTAYRRRIVSMIQDLRTELGDEISQAEGRIEAGRPIGSVLAKRNRRCSALGRYLVARRAGRLKMAEKYLDGALAQLQSCPLYREAAADLLPTETAWALDLENHVTTTGRPRSETAFHWN